MATSRQLWGIGLGLVALALLLLWLRSGLERSARGVAGARRAEEAVQRAAAESVLLGREEVVTEAVVAPSVASTAERVAPAEAPGTDGPRMRVRVRDALDARPVAGALLTLFEHATPLTLRTDEEGTVLVPVPSFERSVRLRAEAAGYFPWSQELVPRPDLGLELDRAAAIFGRVLAADTHAPVGAALLTLQDQVCDGCEPATTLSAADGSYELAAVPLWRPAVLDVRAAGFAPARRVFELRSDAPRIAQDLELVRGVEISGRVEDWLSGRGLAGAHVGELVTDAEGRFRGRLLSQRLLGRTTLDVSAAEHADLRVELELNDGDEHVFRLPGLAFLEGRVTDETGRGLARAKLSFHAEGVERSKDGALEETSPLYEVPEGWVYGPADARAESDDDGHYRLAVLPWSLNAVARAACAGFVDAETQLKSVGEPGSVRRLDWWMRTRSGPALLRGTVTLNSQAAAFEGLVSWHGPTLSSSVRFSRGHYQVEVEPGALALEVALDVAPWLPPREIRARVGPGEERWLPLDVEAPVAQLRGSVRFEDGEGVAEREVFGSCSLPSKEGLPSTLRFRAVTDEGGDFELCVTDVQLPYVVSTANFEGDVLAMPGIAPGASGLDFVLPRGYGVFLRAVERSSGRALVYDDDVQFLMRDGPRHGFQRLEPLADTPDAGGWYEFQVAGREADFLALPRDEVLPLHGARVLRAQKLDGAVPARIELVLERGVDVALERAEGVAPWPEDHELVLVPEDLLGSIWVTRPRYSTPFDELTARSSVRFDEHGRARLRGLAPGSYRFRSFPPDLLVDPEYVRIDAGTLPLLLRWSPRR